MSIASQGSGGAAQNPGGTSEENPNNPKNDPATDVVKYETHKKLLDEKKSRDKDLAEANAKIAQFEQERTTAQTAELEKQKNFEKLLEIEREKNKVISGELGTIKTGLQDTMKLRAFMGAVNGAVDEQYWPLIDLSEIVVDPKTGRVEETSVVKAARDFEKRYPLVLQKGGGVGLPNDAAKGGSSKLAYSDWMKLPDNEKPKRMKDVDPTTY